VLKLIAAGSKTFVNNFGDDGKQISFLRSKTDFFACKELLKRPLPKYGTPKDTKTIQKSFPLSVVGEVFP